MRFRIFFACFFDNSEKNTTFVRDLPVMPLFRVPSPKIIVSCTKKHHENDACFTKPVLIRKIKKHEISIVPTS